jgi:hypothetical protein
VNFNNLNLKSMRFIALVLIFAFATSVSAQRADIKRLRPLAPGSGHVVTSGASGIWGYSFLGSGAVVDTTDADGYFTVGHTAGTSALNIAVTMRDTFNRIATVSAVTDTTFTVRIRTANTGAALSTTAVKFYWIAREED